MLRLKAGRQKPEFGIGYRNPKGGLSAEITVKDGKPAFQIGVPL